MKLHDQHLHSSFSADSEADLLKYYQTAKRNNCKYFITTEHVDLDISMDGLDWLADFECLSKKLKMIEENDGPKTLLGIEMGYRKDKLDRLTKLLNSYEFDLVNLSIHDGGPILKMDYYFRDGFIKYGYKKTITTYYEQMLEAVSTFDNFNVLSHINYGFKTLRYIQKDYDFFEDKDIIEKILKVLIFKGKALEVNTKVCSAFDDSHLIELLKFYKSLGGSKLTLSSDGHDNDHYLHMFDYYKQIIKDCGFDYLCYYVKREEYHYDI